MFALLKRQLFKNMVISLFIFKRTSLKGKEHSENKNNAIRAVRKRDRTWSVLVQRLTNTTTATLSEEKCRPMIMSRLYPYIIWNSSSVHGVPFNISGGGGAGVVTPSKPLRPTNNICLYPPHCTHCFKMFLERSLDDSHPHHPT